MAVVEYLEGDSIVHRLSPVTKIIFLLTILVTSVIFKDIISLAVIFGTTVVFWMLARIPFQKLKVLLLVTLGTVMFFIIFNGFWWWSGRTILFTVPFIDYRPPFISMQHFYLEGLIQGVGIGFKVLSLVCSLPILVMTTPLDQLLRTSSWLRMPYKFTFTMATALRFSPLVSETYEDIENAQKLRGHDIEKMNFVKRLTQAYIPIVTPMIISLLKRSDDLQITIESRAFGAPVKRTYLEEINIKPVDYVVSILLCLFLAISIIDFAKFGQLIPPELLTKLIQLLHV